MALNNYEQTVLSNGLRIVSEYVDSVYSVSLGVCVLAGSNDETGEINGLAHLLEHMAFKGTKNRSAYQIAIDIESLGGNINAFTSKNYTCYHTRLMSEYLEEGVDVLADVVQNNLLLEEDIQREKSVVKEEIKDSEDSPTSAIHDYFIKQLFPDHPYGRAIQGTLESVDNITREQILEFTNKYYNPDNIVIAAAGRVNHKDLVNTVRKYFSQEVSTETKHRHYKFSPIKEQTREYTRSIKQAHVIMGTRIFPRKDERRYELSLLNVILSGGLSSRLFQNVREKYGFVYSIYGFARLYKKKGVFGVYAGTDISNLDKTCELIEEEIHNIAEGDITDHELQQKKQQYKGTAMLSLESMASRMQRLAKMAVLDNELITINELLDRINRISKQDIIEVARYLVSEKQFIKTIIKPANN